MTEKEIQPIALDGKIIDFKTKELIEDLDAKNKKRFTICVDSNNLKSLWDDERTEEEPLLWLTRSDRIGGIDNVCELLNELNEKNHNLRESRRELITANNEYRRKINELNDENQRLTDKLNRTALELVDDVISQGKAVEISEMSYNEFLDYRAKNEKPMELQL